MLQCMYMKTVLILKNFIISNIDKLINSEGQFASWYYAQCVCSTSRSTLLTGRYPLHHGINGAILWTTPMGLNLTEILLPEVLRSHGYQTHAIGWLKVTFISYSSTTFFHYN